MDLNKRYEAFFILLEKPKIKNFLDADECRVLADKYILACIFIYFERACFTEVDYNENNFFLTLYLIHDLYEEVEDFKDDIIGSYLNCKRNKKVLIQNFLNDRFKLLNLMQYNTMVTKYMCICVMKRISHWAWSRKRNKDHIGVFYKYTWCTKCLHI